MATDDDAAPLRRAFQLDICTSCRVGDHATCGPLWDARRSRVAYCECPGFTQQTPGQRLLIPLPCAATTIEKEPAVTEPDQNEPKEPGVPAEQFPDGDDIDSATVTDDGAPDDDL